MIVVADSGPLIHLSMVGQLGLLHELYDRVTVPRRVYDEVVVDGHGLPGSAEVAGAAWIDILDPREDSTLWLSLREELDSGESAALALAAERHAALVLIDDRKGRLAAARLGLLSRGTIGILVQAKRTGKIERIGPVLEALSKSGAWMSQPLIAEALRLAGETV